MLFFGWFPERERAFEVAHEASIRWNGRIRVTPVRDDDRRIYAWDVRSNW
jgi:hypothetical protein